MTNPNPNPTPDRERTERSLRIWLTEGRPPLADCDSQINDVLGRLDEAPQTRARFLGRWFDRGRGARRGTDAHDHPPDTHWRNRLMFSATGLVAAFAVLALSVSVVNTEPAPPNTGAGATYTVDAAGSGDFDTIGEVPTPRPSSSTRTSRSPAMGRSTRSSCMPLKTDRAYIRAAAPKARAWNRTRSCSWTPKRCCRGSPSRVRVPWSSPAVALRR